MVHLLSHLHTGLHVDFPLNQSMIAGGGNEPPARALKLLGSTAQPVPGRQSIVQCGGPEFAQLLDE